MPLDPAAFGELMRVIRGEPIRPSVTPRPAALPPDLFPAAPPAAPARALPAGLFPAAPAAAPARALPAGLFIALTHELLSERGMQNLGHYLRQRAAQTQPALPAPVGPPRNEVLRRGLEQRQENGARAFLRDHLGYVPAGEPLAQARHYGLTSPETYRPGTAQPHPRLYRSPTNLAMTPPPPPLPPPPLPGRQPITPSRALQPQTQRIAPPAPAPQGFNAPDATAWIMQHAPGVTPDQFHQRYFAGFVPTPTVRVSSNGNFHASGMIRAPAEIIAHDRNGAEIRISAGTILGSIDRDIYPSSRRVYNSLFRLDPRYQGLGIARTILRSQVDLYRQMGNIDRVDVTAGLDGGGHTWARFGFLPDASGWRLLRSQLTDRLNRVSNLDPGIKQIARNLINSNDPSSIRELAGLPMRLGSGKSDLGRKLLAGTGWSGTLDLRNPDTMRYFDAYTTPRQAQP